MKYIEARHYTPVGKRSIDLLVFHTMEAPEKPTTAEDVAAWAAGPTAPQASWHYGVDNNTVVQSVHDHDVAWHAPGANHDGLGFEHAGTALQSVPQWHDPYTRAVLARSAALQAQKAKEYNIPVVFLRAPALVAQRRGLTTHWEVTQAFRLGTHTDPGAQFPADEFTALVLQALAGDHHVTNPTSPTTKPPEPVLRLGARGWRVRQMQRLLNFSNDPGVHADGVFGTGTQALVRQFQRRVGLRTDGVCGANTWHALWVARYQTS